MKQSPELLYLNLMKKTLSYILWPEPPYPLPYPLPTFIFKRQPIKKLLLFAISKTLNNLGKKRLQISITRHISEDQRIEGNFHPKYADTMIGLKRLDNLQYCIETVLSKNIEGDFIETGVWRGGACIFMRAVLEAYQIENRKVFVADSFEGLPEANVEKYPADKGDRHHMISYLAISQEEVENNFQKYGLLDNQVVFLKGWFKDTLPEAPINKLSILRLDGDMYGSTMEALEHLYPKLSKKGFCIIDDYGLVNCKAAVDDYRAKHKITAELKKIDWSGVYWEKEKDIS